MADFRDYRAKQEAARLTDDAIAKASGEKNSKLVERSVCLVTSFSERSDLPPGTLLNRMSPAVVQTLASMGLHEPISLRNLPNKWWVANVDIASVNSGFESGGGTVRVTASTEDIVHRYSHYYCEVIDGPFNHPDEINGCYFVTYRFDPQRLGDQARLCILPSWLVSRLAQRGLDEPIPFLAMSGKFWVCGMGGGVCSTEEMEDLMRTGRYRHYVTDGPFDSRGDADYAYDVLWESPE